MRTRVVLGAIAMAAVAGLGCAHKNQEERAPVARVSAPASEPPPAAKKQDVDTSKVARDDARGDDGDAVFFGFENAILDDQARRELQKVVAHLKANPRSTVRIEGNCDERGTTEYNLGLGEERARSAKKYLEALGVSSKRISFISYGKERPKDSGHDETAWAKNRRDDVVVK